MTSKLTYLASERQLAAANPKVSVWTSANAGTGKTHLLVDRLSRLLLNNVTPSRILCLTFTRAAVAEMSVRLEARLSNWATDSKSTLVKKLRELLGREPTRVEISKAQNLFFEILDTPHGIYIRTIHSFCESLLSRFPLEAKLAPYFSIIDERRSRELRREAREQFLL
jgi:ATP-dependent helicase/nuclease subunit A